MTIWTKIGKPTNGTAGQTINAGNPIGFLLALTYATSSVTPSGDIWTKIGKATGTAWTKIGKATGTAWTKIGKAT